MNLDRDNTGRPSGRLAAALVASILTLAVSGAALATPPKGGGCGGGCGGGGGGESTMSRHEASERAGDAAAAGTRDSGVNVSVGSGGRPSEDLAGSIAQLGATEAENARPSDADLATQGYFPVSDQEMEAARKSIEQEQAAEAERMKDPAYRKQVEEEEARWRQDDAEEARERRMDQEEGAEARWKESERGDYGQSRDYKNPDPTDAELAEHGYFGPPGKPNVATGPADGYATGAEGRAPQ